MHVNLFLNRKVKKERDSYIKRLNKIYESGLEKVPAHVYLYNVRETFCVP